MSRTRRRIPWLVLAVALAGASPGDPEPADAWYSQVESDFRPTYDADAANRKAQTWGQYWGWVQTFYKGNLLSTGWTERAKGIFQGVKDPGQTRKLRGSLNDLGRDVCREWAKDNGVRKVDSGDLKRYLAQLEAAGRKDDGSGSEIEKAIATIRADRERKMKPAG